MKSKLLAEIETDVDNELKRRNGEVLQFILSRPLAEDLQDQHAIDRLLNEGGIDPRFSDPDDSSSGDEDDCDHYITRNHLPPNYRDIRHRNIRQCLDFLL
jgi:hypothetical protein